MIKSVRWVQTYRSSSSMNLSEYNAINETFHAKLLQLGFTQTADTGQMLVNAVSPLPTTEGTTSGYRVYAWNDPLHATSPLFLKVTFFVGTGCLPGFELSIGGPTTNGAGTIANALETIRLLPRTYNGAVNAQSITYIPLTAVCYMIMNDGVLSIALGTSLCLLSSGYAHTRPGVPADRIPYTFTTLGRGYNSAGIQQPDRVFFLQANSTNAFIPSTGFGSGLCIPQAKTLVYSGQPLNTNNFTSLVWPDYAQVIEGVVPLGKTYLCFHDTGTVLCPDVLVAGTGEIADEVSVSVSINGTPTSFIHLSDSFCGMHQVSVSITMPTKRYTTPLIKWNGVWE